MPIEGDSMVIDPKMLIKGYGSGFKDWNFSFSRDFGSRSGLEDKMSYVINQKSGFLETGDSRPENLAGRFDDERNSEIENAIQDQIRNRIMDGDRGKRDGSPDSPHFESLNFKSESIYFTETINSLVSQLGDQEKTLDAARSEFESVKQDRDTIHDELTKKESLLDSLKVENDRLAKTIQDTKYQLDSSNSEKAELKTLLETFNSNKDFVYSDHQFSHKLGSLTNETDASNLAKKFEQISTENESLKFDLSNQKKNFEEMMKEQTLPTLSPHRDLSNWIPVEDFIQKDLLLTDALYKLASSDSKLTSLQQLFNSQLDTQTLTAKLAHDANLHKVNSLYSAHQANNENLIKELKTELITFQQK